MRKEDGSLFETRPITDDSLFAANASPEVRSNLDKFYEAQGRGQLTAVFTCGDPRAEPVALFDEFATQIVSLRAIAAETLLDKFVYALNHHGVKQILVLQHHDGTLFVPGQELSGCGGLGAKAKAKYPIHINENVIDIVNHINRIPTSDVYELAYLQAKLISGLVSKPILTASLDHRTGHIYPFAVFEKLGGAYRAYSAIPFGQIGNPSLEYASGIPQLTPDVIPSSLLNLVNDNHNQALKLREKPDILEGLKNNDPRAIFITTSPKSPALRYKYLFGDPNTAFTLGLPFFKEGERDIAIDRNDLLSVFNQLHYPIAHSTTAKPGESFARTGAVIIETPSMALSEDIAYYLVKVRWMKPWLNQKYDGKERNVFVAQVNRGITEDVKAFKYE